MAILNEEKGILLLIYCTSMNILYYAFTLAYISYCLVDLGGKRCK